MRTAEELLAFVLRAQVFDHLVEREHAGAHLIAPAVRDSARQFLLRSRLLLFLQDEQARLQRAHRRGAVLDLILLDLHQHHEPGRQVRDAHGRVGRFDRLPAGAGGAKHIDADVRLGHVDHRALFEQRNDLNRGKAGLPLARGAER